jgi:hypothetical protein
MRSPILATDNLLGKKAWATGRRHESIERLLVSIIGVGSFSPKRDATPITPERTALAPNWTIERKVTDGIVLSSESRRLADPARSGSCLIGQEKAPLDESGRL